MNRVSQEKDQIENTEIPKWQKTSNWKTEISWLSIYAQHNR